MEMINKNEIINQIEYKRQLKRNKLQRRKELIKTIAVISLIAVVSLWALIMALMPAKACGYDYDTCSTLWGLAEKHCPDTVDKRDFIHEVMKLNAMKDTTVYVNRLYQYPVYER